jgi:hypothetical protein
MAVAPLTAAFGIPSQVETIGALAGLAAILGLAVLSMLYFAQARELKRLREWAGRAPERAAELQERVTAGAQAPRRVAPQPRSAAASPSRTSSPISSNMASTASGSSGSRSASRIFWAGVGWGRS